MVDGGRPPRTSAGRQEHASVTVCKHARRAARKYAMRKRSQARCDVYTQYGASPRSVSRCVSSWLGGCKTSEFQYTVERFHNLLLHLGAISMDLRRVISPRKFELAKQTEGMRPLNTAFWFQSSYLFIRNLLQGLLLHSRLRSSPTACALCTPTFVRKRIF